MNFADKYALKAQSIGERAHIFDAVRFAINGGRHPSPRMDCKPAERNTT